MSNSGDKFWTEERTARLKHLIEVDGHSFSEAAKTLGCTRHSAIGRANRQHITSRHPSGSTRVLGEKSWLHSAEAKAQRLRTLHAKRQRVVVKPRLVVVDKPPVLDAAGALYTLETIGPKQCRWSIGDPQDPAFHYCAHPTHADRPYCEGHAVKSAAAQQPQANRPANRFVARDMARAFGGG